MTPTSVKINPKIKQYKIYVIFLTEYKTNIFKLLTHLVQSLSFKLTHNKSFPNKDLFFV